MDKMSLRERFNIAALVVKTLKKKPSDDEMLKIYALYKQSIVGDCNTSQPGFFNMKEKAKWNAWRGVTGITQQQAMIEYIQMVEVLMEKYN